MGRTVQCHRMHSPVRTLSVSRRGVLQCIDVTEHLCLAYKHTDKVSSGNSSSAEHAGDTHSGAVQEASKDGCVLHSRKLERTKERLHVLLRVGDGRAGDHKDGARLVLARAQPPQPPQHQGRMAAEDAPGRPRHTFASLCLILTGLPSWATAGMHVEERPQASKNSWALPQMVQSNIWQALEAQKQLKAAAGITSREAHGHL